MFKLVKKEKIKGKGRGNNYNERVKYVMEFDDSINDVYDVVNDILKFQSKEIEFNICGYICIGNDECKLTYVEGDISNKSQECSYMSLELQRKKVIAGVVEGNPFTGIWDWMLGVEGNG